MCEKGLRMGNDEDFVLYRRDNLQELPIAADKDFFEQGNQQHIA